MKFPIQNVFSVVLWCLCVSGTACGMKLNSRLDPKAAADPQNAFVVAVDIVKAFQIIVDPAIPFIRAVHVNLFDQRSNMLVFLNPLAGISRLPFVIGRRRHRQAAAGFPNRTKMVSRTAANGFVLPFQMKLSQRFPLSSSSTFFRSSHSSFSRWFSCSSSAIRFSSSSSLDRGV